MTRAGHRATRRWASAHRRRSALLFFLPALLPALLLFLAAPDRASAHAILTHSTPHASSTVDAPPGVIQADFNEAVQPATDALRLFDEEGQELEVGASYPPNGQAESVAADVLSDLPEGVYTATYRVTSADGHPVSGGFSFGVGVPVRTDSRTAPAVAELLDRTDPDQPGLEITYGVARAAQYLALLLVIGAVFFRFLVSRRESDDEGRAASLLIGAALLGASASAVGYLMQSALAAGVGPGDILSPESLEAGIDTNAGQAWIARIVIWILLANALMNSKGRTRLVALAVLATALVVTVPIAGHASSQSPRAVLIASDVIHVVGAGAWLGALVLLLAVYWPGRSRPGGDLGEALGATGRFSRLALPAIAVLFAAGVLQSWFYLDGAPAELFTSAYGLLLLAKLVLLGLIAAAGLSNRRQLARAAEGREEAAPRLRRVMRAEVVIAIVVLCVTAALVRVAPPAADGGPQARALDMEDLRVELIIEPATTGPNDYHLYLFDRETGAQVPRVKEITMRLSQEEEGIGPITLDVPYKSPAHYELLGPALGVPGTWDVAIDVRTSRFDVLTGRTEIEVEKP